MRIIQHILLFLALTITVGHMLVAHSHENNSEHISVEAEEAPILDFLKKIFAANIGGEHLEEFKSGKCTRNFVVDAIPAGIISFSQLLTPLVEVKVFKSDWFDFIDSCATHVNYSRKVHISRGSPSIS